MVSTLLAALIIAAAPVRDPLGPYRNLPVLEIDIDAPPGEQVDELKRLVGIAPGYLLLIAAVQTGLKRLYALGRFSEVDLHVEQRAQAVVLHFVLKPVRQLGALRVDDLSQVGQAAFLAALHLPLGSEIDRRTPESLRERGKNYLARVGFPRAELTIDEENVNDNTVNITVRVHEGEPRRVTDIRFVGEPRVRAGVLTRLLRTRIGGVLDSDETERDRERLTRAYLDRGFAKVQVGATTITGDEHTAVVAFSIAAGPRVAVYFVGNRAQGDNELRALWPATTTPLQPGDLGIFVQRITDSYRHLGYPYAQTQLKGFRDSGNIERYVVYVKEGAQVIVTSIDFEGVNAFQPALFVQQVQTVLARELTPQGSVQQLSRPELALAAGDHSLSVLAPPPPEQRWVPELYERALEDIVAVYHDRGYLQATVGPARLEPTADGARVVVPVNEGPQTHVRTLTFLNNAALSNAELEGAVTAAAAAHARDGNELTGSLPLPSTPLSRAGVEDTRIALIRRYRDEGYLYASVFPDVKISQDQTQADVSFRLEEGPQVHIDNVLIRGNRNTRTDLIQSHMTLKAGELYRLNQALQDQRNVADLGVFSSVRVRLVDEQTPAERKDVVAEVVERNRQAFELWPGISTADGPRLRVDYSHLNLYGTATSLNISLKLNWKMFFGFYGEYANVLAARYDNFSIRERTEIEARAGIRSPRFTSYPLETGVRFDLVGERQNAIPYSFDAGRAIFGIDMLALRRLGVTIEPQFSLTNLQCFPNTTQNQSANCQDTLLTATPDRRRLDEGLRAEFKVGPSLTLDLRDSAFNPTRGFLANARAIYGVGATLSSQALERVSGIVPSDWVRFSFVRVEGSLGGYVPLGHAVLALTARAGTVLTGNVPIDERFYLGGGTTMRGFQETGMLADDVCVVTRANNSPRSLPGHCVWRNRAYVTTEKGVYVLPLPTGADHFVLLKAELRLPLTNQFILALFVDAGNLWLTQVAWSNMRLRTTPGVGLRYATPAGPIGIDVGFNPAADPYRSESIVNVQFAVGVF